MKKYLLMACLLFSSTAQAQPEKVIVHTDGEVELILYDPPLSAVETAAINTVPVFTLLEDGSLLPGSVYRGMSSNGAHTGQFPSMVTLGLDGLYKVHTMQWVAMGPRGVMWEHKPTGYDTITIVTNTGLRTKNEPVSSRGVFDPNVSFSGCPAYAKLKQIFQWAGAGCPAYAQLKQGFYSSTNDHA